MTHHNKDCKCGKSRLMIEEDGIAPEDQIVVASIHNIVDSIAEPGNMPALSFRHLLSMGKFSIWA